MPRPEGRGVSLRTHATPELYLRAAGRLPLQPALTVYYDPHLRDGWYTTLGAGHQLQWRTLGLGLHTTVGYNHGQFGADPGWGFLEVGVPAAFRLGTVRVSPALAYLRSFESTGQPQHHLRWGLAVGLAP